MEAGWAVVAIAERASQTFSAIGYTAGQVQMEGPEYLGANQPDSLNAETTALAVAYTPAVQKLLDAENTSFAQTAPLPWPLGNPPPTS